MRCPGAVIAVAAIERQMDLIGRQAAGVDDVIATETVDDELVVLGIGMSDCRPGGEGR